jgi:hypothetical protein
VKRGAPESTLSKSDCIRRAQWPELLADQGVEPAMRPVVAIVLLSSLAQVLALESAIDVSRGHAETLEYVDECLRAFAQGRPTPLEQAQTGSSEAEPAAAEKRGKAAISAAPAVLKG